MGSIKLSFPWRTLYHKSLLDASPILIFFDYAFKELKCYFRKTNPAFTLDSQGKS
jgi:hypothetical protein